LEFFRAGLFSFLMWITTTSDDVAFRMVIFVAWVFLEMAFPGNLQEDIRNLEAGQAGKG
jgi:hypothetical protein